MDARIRLEEARQYLAVARHEAAVGDDAAACSVSTSNSVLAGIAASDAACCKRTRRRSSSEDHRDAERLLAQVQPGGKEAANTLRRLLAVKTDAHYGTSRITAHRRDIALRHATKLVEFAESTLGQR